MRKEIQNVYDYAEPFYMILGDCVVPNIKVETKLKVFLFQIQGGKGWDVDYSSIENCQGAVLSVSFANAASAVEDVEIWENRFSVYEKILTSISNMSSGKCPVLIIDRPGTTYRYWNLGNDKFKEIMKTRNFQHGIPESVASEYGWTIRDVQEQNKRREEYKYRLKKIFDKNNVVYVDFYEFFTKKELEKFCSEEHKQLVNLAPWHIYPSWKDMVSDCCNHFFSHGGISDKEVLSKKKQYYHLE